MTQHIYTGQARKGLSIWMLLFCMLTFGASLKAQNATIQIGTGSTSNTSSYLPLNAYYGYSYTQQIYYASELAAAGAANGSINKIRFYYASGGMSLTNAAAWDIYLGLTSKTSFTSNTDWVPLAQLTQVFGASVTFSGTTGPANGWVEIAFTTPFPYTTGNNLIVAIDENTPSYTNSTAYWSAENLPNARSIYYYNDNTNPNPSSPPTANGTFNGYSSVQFNLVIPPCSGTPNPGNTISSIPALCVGSTASLTIQNDYLNVPGITYQWQTNNGSGWTSIATATNSTYQVPSSVGSASYQAVLTCSATASGTTTALNLPVVPVPTVAVTPSISAVCSTGSTITASGAVSYTWSPALGLSSTTGTANVATPTVATMYSITGVDANNCATTTTISVTPVNKMPLNVNYSAVATCSPGSPIAMQATTYGSTTSPGSWEYQFLGNGNSVLQAWGAASGYTPTPATSGNYNYKITLRNVACPTEVADTAFVNVVIGFGANVGIVDVNCKRPAGSLLLTNTFGQKPWDTLSIADFTAAPNFSVSFTSGNAAVTGGRCVLTPSVSSNKGGLTFLNPNNLNPQNAAYDISFLMTNDQPFGAQGGDGMAWSFGDDAAYVGTATAAHGGFGTKLRISFDSYTNGTNLNGIYLMYGYASTATSPSPTSTGVLAYSGNMAWKYQTDMPVSIRISEDGKLTLTVGGTIIFSDKQLPASFVTANKTTWTNVFSAQTGGEAMRQAIDDVKIRYRYRINYGIVPGTSTTTMPSSWQNTPAFTGLNPGSYGIWMSNSSDLTCNSFLGTFQVRNINPVVNLGHDTAICAGAQLVLDAGNPTSAYLWSNNLGTARTITVTTPGTYMVSVTDTANCNTSGVIHVMQAAVPSGSSVYSTMSNINGTDYIFSVVNPQNVVNYSWNFGDGSTLPNGPATVAHTYTTNGTYTVTAVLSNPNGCGTATVATVINVLNTTGVEELGVSGSLSVFPNPAGSQVSVAAGNGQIISAISVYDMAGKLVQRINAASATVSLDVTLFENGVYTLEISTDKGLGHKRLMIAK